MKVTRVIRAGIVQVLCLMFLILPAFAVMAGGSAEGPRWDPEYVLVDGSKDATLIDIEVSSFKGGRLEPYRIPLDGLSQLPGGEFDRTKTDYTVTVDYSSRTSTVMYVKPVAYSPNSTFVIDGAPSEFNVPFRKNIVEGKNTLSIEVTAPDGAVRKRYTLTIDAKNLWSGYKSDQIATGLWHIGDASGFVTNDSMYLFVGKDKAMLFDAGMGEGDLRAEVNRIIALEGRSADLPIEVVITHGHGDHFGRAPLFADSTVYWPLKDAHAIPATYTQDALSKFVFTRDGDFINGPDGRIFECVSVISHTAGSMVYLDTSGKYLITGDAISSCSYVWDMLPNTPTVVTYNKELKKLEEKVKPFTDIYMLPGHAWQESVFPLRGYPVNQLITDMRIATDTVLEKPSAGYFTTRSTGNETLSVLRQFQYGLAGYWYDHLNVYPDAAALEFLGGFAESLRRDVIRPSFNAYVTQYTATIDASVDSIEFTPVVQYPGSTVKINGLSVANGGSLKVSPPLNAVTNYSVEVTNRDAVKVYQIAVKRGEGGTLPEATPWPANRKDNLTNPSLIDIKVSSFKGGRLEPYNIGLDDFKDRDFDPQQTQYRVTVDWGSRTSTTMYIQPVTYSERSTYKIDGVPCDFNQPYPVRIKEGENKYSIEVQSGNGQSVMIYTLIIDAKPLWAGYNSVKIDDGIWRVQDASGFTTNDDIYLFVGSDKALMFDTGMGEGDLRAEIKRLIKLEGGSDTLPIEIAITHAHGDHYGKVEQFRDAKVYWPKKDWSAIPVTYTTSRYAAISDGDLIAGPTIHGKAFNFRCIEVSCHTIGAMTYLDAANRYLAVGDAVGSGSYVFNFGNGKEPVEVFYRDLVKLENAIKDIDSLYVLSGHSWQEQPVPLQGLAGKQMISDMRFAAESVLSGAMRGKLTTRAMGSNVEELRQLKMRAAGFWYNGWAAIEENPALENLEIYSNTQNRSLVRGNFAPYNTSYTARLADNENTLKLTMRLYNLHGIPDSISVNGTVAGSGNRAILPSINHPSTEIVREIDVTGLSAIAITVKKGAGERTYTVNLTRPALSGQLTTQGGLVTGVMADNDTVTTFKGIPFAAPPVGVNRWKAPQPPARWSGVRACDTYAPMAWQILSVDDSWGGEFYYDYINTGDAPLMSEDCLYLNVTTASTDTSVRTDKRPVYVFFHGGASYHGFSYEAEMNPAALAAKGIIVVTAAYRVGFFGYYANDQLDAETSYHASGNYGLLDQIAALKWVKENIAAFGGDPDQVTIGGQSAGAQASRNLITSPLAKGLFKRAIMESSISAFATLVTLDDVKTRSANYLKLKGLEGKSLAELRAIPPEFFINSTTTKDEYYQGLAQCIDGYALVQQPKDFFLQPGVLDGIDLLYGSNDGESSAWGYGTPRPIDTIRTSLQRTYGDLYGKYNFESLYPLTDINTANDSNDYASAELTFMRSRIAAELFAINGKNTYVYYFDHWPSNSSRPGRDPARDKSWHSSELWYVFNSMRNIPQQRAWTPADRQMAETLSSYWANFIKTGNPNGAGLPNWPSFSASSKTFMELGKGLEYKVEAKTSLYTGTLANRDALLREKVITEYGLEGILGGR
ncbi:carboxylesterase family [Treponema primitia ZAS-2]|uniref:Carboxylesterase family n=1 Tax=Treponema primitia (strain ATCC BAA-887 / DSM 12427 / ZAS-2) TaxID=545694 RepID=F5YNV0_TREPZ|nr:carboxylesterase family protein [Treponema primitia]AEF83691.1 carboxylesterase family [Treponema primitia ZAS-2]